MVFAGKQTRTWLGVIGAFLLLDLVAYSVWRLQREQRYDGHIREAARRYNLEPALIKAVIWQESRFQSNARGAAGEIGLMQVCEEAALEWAESEKLESFRHEEIVDPGTNILAGSFYLAKCMRRYTKADNPVPYALADYNAGRTHVLRWNKGTGATNSLVFLAQMDYPGTRQYALAVMERYKHYKRRFF